MIAAALTSLVLAAATDGGVLSPLRTVQVRECTEAVNKDQQVEGPLDCRWPDGKPKYLVSEIHGKREGEARSWNQAGKLIAIEHYKNDQRDGLTVRYDDQGQLTEQTNFKAGSKEGLCKEYRAGKLERQRNYLAGQERGPFVEYWPNGNVKQRGTHGSKGLDGLAEWFREDGKPDSSLTLDNGQANGPKREYWPNGQLRAEELWHLDQQDGLAKTFHDNGTPEATYCYQKSKRAEGLSACLGIGGAKETVTSQFANGKPSEITTYDRGRKNGSHQVFWPAGAPKEISNYRDEQLDGDFERFYASGLPQLKVSYKNGKKDGTEERFLENGKRESKVTWKADAQVARQIFWENGKPKLAELQEGKLWHRRMYGDDGQLRIDGFVRPHVWLFSGWDEDYDGASDELREGLERTYAADGSLESETTYAQGAADGPATLYYPNGKVRQAAVYARGHLMSRKDYDALGNLQLDERYNDDGSRK